MREFPLGGSAMEFNPERTKSCVVARHSFIVVQVVVMSFLLLAGVVALYQDADARGFFLLLLVYLFYGGLYFFSRLSNLACPAKVLLVGFAFISVSSLVNLLAF